MNEAVHNRLVAFIWAIADSCLRDVYVRGKYRDVILPMLVLRRLDAMLEPTKQSVLEEVAWQKETGLAFKDEDALERATGQCFYNTSKWTLSRICSEAGNNRDILVANIDEYLEGFSGNVQDIISCFHLMDKVKHMAKKNVLLAVLEKFVDPYINLTPEDKDDPEGNLMPGLSNLNMGYVFEEIIRKFNEENNEEAGEHFTPREVIHLMTHLLVDPVEDRLPATLSIYDPACGSGGMLTECQKCLTGLTSPGGLEIKTNLHGREINDETYAICKSDMMISGDDPQYILPGSTLSHNEFSGKTFDFMLSNPPYGKSWSSEQKNIRDSDGVIDNRFRVNLTDYWGNKSTQDATPRSSDGQLLFLLEMISKMKSLKHNPAGSRIASVHNGSSLFTGDAGSGESNIRRHIIENDMLDAIIQLPANLFYNTGITTYIWLLAGTKPAVRKGKVQLIDGSLLYRKLRKNQGNKNCEFSEEHIETIRHTYMDFKPVERVLDENGEPTGLAVKIFDNEDFGYHKVTIERPDRRSARFSMERLEPLRFDKSLRAPMELLWDMYGERVYEPGFLIGHKKEILQNCSNAGMVLKPKLRDQLVNLGKWESARILYDTGLHLMQIMGTNESLDFNVFREQVNNALKTEKIKLTASQKTTILNAVSRYDERGGKVVDHVMTFNRKTLSKLLDRLGCAETDLADFGYYAQENSGWLTYERATHLRDSETIPLKIDIHDYFRTEVQPHVPDAWIDMESVKIGYEINFNRYFYYHKPLRSLESVAKDLIRLEQHASVLMEDILRQEI